MVELLGYLLATAGSALKARRDLAMENLALRQHLAVLKRERRRPQLTDRDRLFWVWMSRIWADWAEALLIVKPETVHFNVTEHPTAERTGFQILQAFPW